MKNDSLTIEEKNYVRGIAGLLTKYGFATVNTEKIEEFLGELNETFGIKAHIDQRELPGKNYLIRTS